MRTTVSMLRAAALATAGLAAAALAAPAAGGPAAPGGVSTAKPAPAPAAKPAEDIAAEVPHMTREQALAYVGAKRLALVPSNLVAPIMNGNAELVEALLSAGVDANDPTDMPKSVLRLAANACAGEQADTRKVQIMIEVLLAHGARVNEPPESVLSPLMVAAQNCPAPVVRRLVRAGADLKFRTPQGFTPLSMALIVGNYDAAEALIDAGARLSPEAAQKLLAKKNDDARLAALVKRARAK